MGYWRYFAEPAPPTAIGGVFEEYVLDYVLYHAEAAADICPQTKFLSTFPLSDYISSLSNRPSGGYMRFGPRRFSLDQGKVDLLYVLSYDGFAKLITAFLQLEDIGRRTAEREGKHRFPAFAAAANGH